MSFLDAAPAMDIDMSIILPENAPVASPNAADDDEVTVAGSNRSPSPIPTATDPTSLVLKLEFRSPTKETPSVYANQAKMIIAKIMEKFPNEVSVFDNQEKAVKQMNSTISCDKFNRKFILHVRKSSPKAQKKQHCHFYQFRIATTTTFSDLRKHPEVEQLLKSYEAILQTTPWNADVVDTATLGWQMGLIPSYMTSTEATEHIRRTLEMNSGKSAKKIPTFHCIPQTITATLKNRKITIKAYCVSVQKVHFHKMSDIFARAFMNEPKEKKFIFFKTKHESPEIFAKAAFVHAKFVDSHRVVAIKGINPDHYFDFEEELRTAFPPIKDIFRTASTTARNVSGHYVGRYNLLCSTEDFVPLANELHDHLSPLYIKHATEVHGVQLSNGMEPVLVVSKFPGKPGLYGGSSVGSVSSLTTRNSYNTEIASVFEGSELDFEMERDDPAPTHFTTTATITTVSPLTTQPASYAEAVTRNLQQQPTDTQRLEKKIEDLTAVVATLMQRLNQDFYGTGTGAALPQRDAIQPSPARIRKKTKPSDDQGGTSMDVTAVNHNNHESS